MPSRSSAKRAVALFFVFTHWRSPGGYGSRSRFPTTPSRPRSQTAANSASPSSNVATSRTGGPSTSNSSSSGAPHTRVAIVAALRSANTGDVPGTGRRPGACRTGGEAQTTGVRRRRTSDCDSAGDDGTTARSWPPTRPQPERAARPSATPRVRDYQLSAPVLRGEPRRPPVAGDADRAHRARLDMCGARVEADEAAGAAAVESRVDLARAGGDAKAGRRPHASARLADREPAQRVRRTEGFFSGEIRSDEERARKQ